MVIKILMLPYIRNTPQKMKISRVLENIKKYIEIKQSLFKNTKSSRQRYDKNYHRKKLYNNHNRLHPNHYHNCFDSFQIHKTSFLHSNILSPQKQNLQYKKTQKFKIKRKVSFHNQSFQHNKLISFINSPLKSNIKQKIQQQSQNFYKCKILKQDFPLNLERHKKSIRLTQSERIERSKIKDNILSNCQYIDGWQFQNQEDQD